MIKALAAYFIGSACVFLQHNLQFINDYFKDKTHLLILATSIPISYLYLYAWTYFVNNNNGSVWSARFIFFGLSYFVHPVMAYVFLNESPFSAKTALCTLLSVFILLIQYKL
tara:strand:+ start:129 stop:464 length:336 start_codon:yes stop_codon:yes gene_type:complete